jgi:hypothetical protein
LGIALGSLEHLLGETSVELADLLEGKGRASLLWGCAFRHVCGALFLLRTTYIGKTIAAFQGACY